jgi:hypothetical protein
MEILTHNGVRQLCDTAGFSMRPPARVKRCLRAALACLKGLVEVLANVVDVLETNRQTH